VGYVERVKKLGYLANINPFDYILVVAQHYESEPENEYVIRGNNVVLKCKIPSFVADFLHVVSWFDSDGNEFTPQNQFGTANNFISFHKVS